MIGALLTSQALLAISLFGAALAVRLSPRQNLRLAQLLVLLSVALPPLLTFAPQPRMPALRFHRIFRDPDGAAKRHRLPRNTAASLNAAAPVVAEGAEGAEDTGGFRVLARQAPLWLGIAWLLGALFLAVRASLSFRGLLRLLRGAACLRCLGKVRVLASGDTSVPFSFRGWGACYVVLPESLLDRASDRRIAVLHELQHHRQGDTLWAPFEELLQCLFYPNPTFALWRRRISEAQEFSCDEVLIGRKGVSKRDYGSCLVRVAETALGSRGAKYAGTAYMAAASRNPFYLKSFLSRRIEMITEKRRAPLPRAVGVVLGTLLGLGLAAAACLAEGVRREGDAPNPGAVATDPRIQEIAQKILADAVREEHAREGFAIVADPQAGRILAIANVDSRGVKTGHWSLAQRLEPASIAKTLVVAEALEEGKTNPDAKHFCENGSYSYGGKVFHDWRDHGFSYLTTSQTIEKSSDICATKIADLVGQGGLLEMLERFGFGKDGTASAFPESRPGVLPEKTGPMLVPSVAYGQGFQTTPIEIVQAYGAIANGGELLAPISANEPGRRVIRRVLTRENSESVKHILQGVVLRGTAQKGASEFYSTAGKTATGFTQEIEGTFWGDKAPVPNLAAFVGFAPVGSPRVEVYVGILDPHTDESGAHGAAHAVPVFKKITEAVLQEWGVAPDKL